MTDPDPRISRLLYQLTQLECIVLFVTGIGLFFLPSLLTPGWPWELTPFNTRFLGGIYLGALASTSVLTWIGRWSPARVVVPMILIFTSLVLVISFMYRDRFTGNSIAIIGWFGLYLILPLNSAYHLWLYRTLSPAAGVRLPALLRSVLGLGGLMLGGYGILLLIAPATAGGFWPWVIDDFHARVYSTTFITPALGAWLVLNSATRAELRTLGLTGLVGGSAPVIGLLLVDASVHRVNWGLPGTWLWIVLFTFMAGIGLWLLIYTRRLTGEPA